MRAPVLPAFPHLALRYDSQRLTAACLPVLHVTTIDRLDVKLQHEKHMIRATTRFCRRLAEAGLYEDQRIYNSASSTVSARKLPATSQPPCHASALGQLNVYLDVWKSLLVLFQHPEDVDFLSCRNIVHYSFSYSCQSLLLIIRSTWLGTLPSSPDQPLSGPLRSANTTTQSAAAAHHLCAQAHPTFITPQLHRYSRKTAFHGRNACA